MQTERLAVVSPLGLDASEIGKLAVITPAKDDQLERDGDRAKIPNADQKCSQ